MGDRWFSGQNGDYTGRRGGGKGSSGAGHETRRRSRRAPAPGASQRG